MFQKRMRIAQELGVEFVAGGRIWVLSFYMGLDGMWHVAYRLSKHNFPVHPNAVLVIEAHRGPPDCATPEPLRLSMGFLSRTLVTGDGPQIYTEIERGQEACGMWDLQIDACRRMCSWRCVYPLTCFLTSSP
ncbi:uncharacterized protein EDB91DRAFT_1107354 [Suillus paluster]|uniref:uncharacterized protein n=1 Tax=Suillus paluster TaxID=48578 RepID=UPI001B86A405|nr:uncharacterized protein EDB91DRAFT_1107354 [Suillus paluster]KAG1750424.1 hypothetical protein EDB91DRAFT_1107354 [Suillus paluster]